MITYNQERFIVQALESALMQETSFSFEIVIGDDCSQDNTRPILESYAQLYPDRIRLIARGENLGVNRNLIETLSACRGQYVALLEGDDYWTSPAKLQKQVDFLDAHPECNLCFHPVRVVYEESKEPDTVYPAQHSDFSTIEDLLRTNFIQTNSVMYRCGLASDVPQWFYTVTLGDWPLHIINARHGQIGAVDDIMAVYRIHAGGVWSPKSREYKIRETLKIYYHLDAYLEFRYTEIITEMMLLYKHQLIIMAANSGDLRNTLISVWHYHAKKSRQARINRMPSTLAVVNQAVGLYLTARKKR